LLHRVRQVVRCSRDRDEAPRRRHLPCHHNLLHTSGQLPGSAKRPSAGIPARNSATDGWRQGLGVRRDRQRNELQPLGICIGARPDSPEAGGRKMGLHEVSCTPKTSNKAIEPTASRRTTQLDMSSTLQSAATGVSARGGSSCSR
jgi:hypothetical protein